MGKFLDEDINFVVSLNTEKAIKTTLIDLLYKSELSENELAYFDTDKKQTSIQNKGIAINKELIYFYDVENNATIQGFICHINDEKAFNRIKIDDKKLIKNTNGKQGILIILNKNADSANVKHAESVVRKAMQTTPNQFSYNNEKPVLNVRFKGNEHTYANNVSVNLEVKDDKIIINGSGTKNHNLLNLINEHHVFSHENERKHLHIQAGKIPNSLYKYFTIILEDLNLDLPQIIAQQLDLYGFSIENISGSTTFLPKIDWLLKFETPLNLKERMKAIESQNDRIEIIDSSSFKIGSIQYYCQQISEDEIYIGVTKNPKLEKHISTSLPFIKGDPAVTLNIEGEGLIAQIVNVMPPVKNSKDFLEKIEHFEIKIVDQGEDKLGIEGEIKLYEDQLISTELLLLALKFAG
ncbi:hypothetical protein [Brumimicrobium salinarum]|uniref:hypothetical protein n=1 Tax=Brumimicrobium salinarum TaxID=2058658 RepID=UPI0010559F4A|nr:hypothetical protein [Brumimicrobium salinarum]